MAAVAITAAATAASGGGWTPDRGPDVLNVRRCIPRHESHGLFPHHLVPLEVTLGGILDIHPLREWEVVVEVELVEVEYREEKHVELVVGVR